MPEILLSAVLSIDQLCEQAAVLIHSSEPQIYGLALVAAVIGYLAFPPEDDPDRV
jgi:hypothetical protein